MDKMIRPFDLCLGYLLPKQAKLYASFVGIDVQAIAFTIEGGVQENVGEIVVRLWGHEFRILVF